MCSLLHVGFVGVVPSQQEALVDRLAVTTVHKTQPGGCCFERAFCLGCVSQELEGHLLCAGETCAQLTVTPSFIVTVTVFSTLPIL